MFSGGRFSRGAKLRRCLNSSSTIALLFFTPFSPNIAASGELEVCTSRHLQVECYGSEPTLSRIHVILTIYLEPLTMNIPSLPAESARSHCREVAPPMFPTCGFKRIDKHCRLRRAGTCYQVLRASDNINLTKNTLCRLRTAQLTLVLPRPSTQSPYTMIYLGEIKRGNSNNKIRSKLDAALTQTQFGRSDNYRILTPQL